MALSRKLIYAAAAVTGGSMAVSLVMAPRLIARAARSFSKRTDLAGKVVLITGGTRGLGLAMAEEFSRHGAQLVICARDEEELSRAEAHIERMGATVRGIACDVTSEAEVKQMIENAEREFGGIDILVNNAGEIAIGPYETHTLDDFRHAMDVMFWAHVYAVNAVVPHMLRRGGGSIVNITSIGGKLAVPHLLPYSCAKFAAVGLSEGLTAELANRGIRVTTVVPGLMRTGSHQNAFFKGDHGAEFSWFALGATLPIASISAHRAARAIVNAARMGSAEVVLGVPAKLALAVHGLFPGVTAKALGIANRLMPGTGRTNQESLRGYEVDSFLKNSMLTVLGRRAARRLNQPGSAPIRKSA